MKPMCGKTQISLCILLWSVMNFESWGIKQMKASSEVPAWFEQVCKLVWIITLCTWLQVPFHMVLIMLYTVQSFYKFILLRCTTLRQTTLCQTVCNLCTPISLLPPPLSVASPFLRLHQWCTNAMFPLGFLDILWILLNMKILRLIRNPDAKIDRSLLVDHCIENLFSYHDSQTALTNSHNSDQAASYSKSLTKNCSSPMPQYNIWSAQTSTILQNFTRRQHTLQLSYEYQICIHRKTCS